MKGHLRAELPPANPIYFQGLSLGVVTGSSRDAMGQPTYLLTLEAPPKLFPSPTMSVWLTSPFCPLRDLPFHCHVDKCLHENILVSLRMIQRSLCKFWVIPTIAQLCHLGQDDASGLWRVCLLQEIGSLWFPVCLVPVSLHGGVLVSFCCHDKILSPKAT